MSSLIKYLFGFVAILIPSLAMSANHAINPICSTNGDGTSWGCASSQGGSGAWNTIPASFGLTRGDAYYLADGLYSGGIVFSTPTSGTSVITIKKATASDYGGLSGWVSSYGDGQATFNNNIGFTSSYWVFDGVTGGGPGSWGSGYGIKVTDKDLNIAIIDVSNGATNVTIKHLELVGSGYESTNDGIGVSYSGGNFLASYIWMHDIGRCPVPRPVNNGTSIFEYLYVSSYWARGTVHGEILSAHPSGIPGNTTFRYSLFTDVQSTGGLMWDNHGNTNAHLYVYGNVFYKPTGSTWNYGNGVIAGWTGGGGELFSNVHVYNNTFINISGNVFYTYFNAGAYNSANNEVYNNIFYNSTSPAYVNASGDTGNIWKIHNYNYYINSGGTHSEANGTSASSGDSFLDYARYNFNLSTPTKAGLSLSSPFNTDPNRITRGGDGIWDIGAYEFNGGANISTDKYPEYPIIIIK